jgi:cytochrome P450
MTIHQIDDFAGCLHALKQPDLRQALYDEAAILMETVVVNLHGAEHRARREVEATIFRKDVFLHYEKVILPRVLNETLAPFLGAGRGDLKDIGYRILLNLTVDFTGIDRPARTADETGDLLRLLREFSLAPALGQRLDEDTAPLKSRIKAAIDDFDTAYFTASLQRREQALRDHQAGKLGKDGLPKDVLMALVAARESLGMTREQILKEAIYFILAGAHTSINALTHATHDILQWLEVCPDDRARVFDDPFFIQACVFESLRLNPSSPVAKRRALCAVNLGAGEAARDDEVVVNLRAANRTAGLFGDDPTVFNPHRAAPAGQLPYGLSMGHGAHACLGRNLAVGVVPRKGADHDGHQYGTVPLIVEALFRGGVAPDVEHPPRRDETIARFVWAEYPVVFRTAVDRGA